MQLAVDDCKAFRREGSQQPLHVGEDYIEVVVLPGLHLEDSVHRPTTIKPDNHTSFVESFDDFDDVSGFHSGSRGAPSRSDRWTYRTASMRSSATFASRAVSSSTTTRF